ncbi:MAG: hypothetical protein JEZ07_04715 [Phycisphaerae bacterium]|nr:hypothetical protein [Phycisphaerae bacterium]
MNNINKQIIDTITDALSSGESIGEIDEEAIAIIASGQLNRLPQDRRDEILRHIIANPAAAELLADLEPLNLADNSRSNSRSLYIAKISLAIAACLMIGFFAWFIIEPPQASPILENFNLFNAENQGSDYWSQVNQQRLAQNSGTDYFREIALIASTVSCLILSIIIVTLTIKTSKTMSKDQ